MGTFNIGLTVLFSYGISSAFGYIYSPMHAILPFLFLAIGIDDMFVIMQSFDNLQSNEKDVEDIRNNIGLTMKRAGVAITVTSMTDIVVFGVGSSTVSQQAPFLCNLTIVLFVVDFASLEIVLQVQCYWNIWSLLATSDLVCGRLGTWSEKSPSWQECLLSSVQTWWLEKL